MGVSANIDSSNLRFPVSIELFGEEQSQVVVTCSSESMQALRDLAEGYGLLGALYIGTVGGAHFEIKVDQEIAISALLSDLRAGWSTSLESQLAEEVTA